MAEKKALKGVRLGGENLSWFNKKNNSSEAVRKAIAKEIILEKNNIDFTEAIDVYSKLKEEFKEDTYYHFKQALKIYKQYLNQINNVNIQIENNNTVNKKVDNIQSNNDDIEFNKMNDKLDKL